MSLQVFAQEPTKEEWKAMSRQERKEYRLQEAIANQEAMMQVLTAKAWVLEAHQLQDRYGETVQIESSINFVGVLG